MNLAIIFGGNSLEHTVSIISAANVINNLDKDKYKIRPIYLDKDNNWYKVTNLKDFKCLNFGDMPKHIKKIDPFKYLKNMDVAFPVMHGAYGEDGAVQGFLKMQGIPFVGCDILASGICMDKFYTKYILNAARIPVALDIKIKYNNNAYYLITDNFKEHKVSINNIDEEILQEFGYPVFVKPARLGSSVGVAKAHNKKELESALNEAKEYDSKILIEECIVGRELECAILNGKAVNVGEIHANGEFYSYASKYQDEKSFTNIPKDINKSIITDLKNYAGLAFKVVDGKGLARVDFFLEAKTNRIVLNEINTMPGFTEISMYPKMCEEAKIKYGELLDILIASAS